MPITGTEDVLKQLLHDKIKQEMQAVGGAQNILKDEWFMAFCKGVSEAIIAHLVANIQVNAGQITASTGATGSGPPGGPLPIPVLPGAVTTTGTIS